MSADSVSELPMIDPKLAMTDPAAMTAFNRLLIGEFRANVGRLSGVFTGMPILLLTTVGAKTGQPHTVPIGYVPHPNDSGYVVAASKSGAPSNPAWYHNLLAAGGAATVEVGAERFEVRAEVTSSTQRAELHKRLVETWPMQADYQASTKREIPVLILRRQH